MTKPTSLPLGITITASGTRYLGGKPCPRGHVGERFINTRKCCICDDLDRGPRSSRVVGRKPKAVPRDFMEVLSDQGVGGAARHYGVSPTTISKWKRLHADRQCDDRGG